MGQHLFSIRVLFHAAFACVYLPTMVLGFTSGLSWAPWYRLQVDGVLDLAGGTTALPDPAEMSIVMNHFDGIVALASLLGLGIFAAL